MQRVGLETMLRLLVPLAAAALVLGGCRSTHSEEGAGPRSGSSDCRSPTFALSSTDEGSGRPIVMLGGVVTGASGLSSLAGAIAAHRRVIRLQNLNVQAALSGSPLPDGYGVRTERCAMRAALDGKGLAEPVDVVGYSYGGLIALDFALRHPDRVRSLTLIEPPAQWLLTDEELRAAEQVRFARAAMTIRQRDPSDREAAAFVCIVFGCAAGDELQQARQLPLWPAVARNRGALAGVYSVVEHRPPRSELRQLRAPVLYVSGIGTSAFHGRINARFRQALPQARHVELPGGHAAPAASSAALAALILSHTDF